ncbi:C6 zinc finger domain-containing protein [Colletotrichum incanum]|nr:C6 zinc finger domain-containing protein [Colletotrichum incanum]
MDAQSAVEGRSRYDYGALRLRVLSDFDSVFQEQPSEPESNLASQCDESHPSCADCTRRGVRCAYLAPSTHLNASSSATSSPSATFTGRALSSESIPLLLPRPSILSEHAEEELSPLSPFATKRWAASIELMHHYTTSTADTLALRTGMQHVWRTVVPQMGYEHPFVLHGILATRGLEGFRTALFYIGDTNWKPSFCFSPTIVLYVCALAAHSAREPAAGTLSEILKLFVLIRGFRSALLPCQADVLETPLAPLAHGVWIVSEHNHDFEHDASLDASLLPKGIFDSLRRLSAFFQTDLPEGSRRDYEFAVSELRKATILLAKAEGQSEVGMIFFLFPYTLPSNIIADIQVGNPYVMVLLSYFALSLSVIESSFWFLQGWSEQLFKDIEWQLKDNPRLCNVAQWPKKKAAELYK